MIGLSLGYWLCRVLISRVFLLVATQLELFLRHQNILQRNVLGVVQVPSPNHLFTLQYHILCSFWHCLQSKRAVSGVRYTEVIFLRYNKVLSDYDNIPIHSPWKYEHFQAPFQSKHERNTILRVQLMAIQGYRALSSVLL